MRNLKSTTLLFELSQPGRRGATLPVCDVPVPSAIELIPAAARAASPPPLPEVAEPEVIRHFTNLSTLNMSVDTHFYPLGSCTMKYNSKRNERMAALPGIADLHPLAPEETIQGLLELLYELQHMLAEISGLPAVSLQPAAGAHGELTALMVAAAYFRHQQQPRTKVLAPDSAHGTNPASARMAGFEFVTVKSNASGFVDLEDLAAKLDDSVAVFMITNPSTLGLFDRQVGQIAKMVHDRGGLIYLDGANMNAILGITRPGDFGADMMHYNPHKTFSGPHGGGGPGAGPICVAEKLAPYLPTPIVVREEGSEVRVQGSGTDDRTSSLNPEPRTLNPLPIAFCAVLATLGWKRTKRITRLVVLPEFQGLGIGPRLAETVAAAEVAKGNRVTITASHPSILAWCSRSPRWKYLGLKKTGSTRQQLGQRTIRCSTGRAVASFEFVPDQ